MNSPQVITGPFRVQNEVLKVSQTHCEHAASRPASSTAGIMSDTRSSLLYRVYSFWTVPWRGPVNIAATMYAALQHPINPKRARLPNKPADLAPPPATFLSLPTPVQEEIVRFLPTKDRVSHIPLVCTQMAAVSRSAGPIWEELVIDAEVIGHCLRLDVLESWLTARGVAVKVLTIKSLTTWSENSADGEISLFSSGVIPKIITFCKVSLQSLTITDCDSVFAEADFAALAALSQLEKLHIDTDAQVHPRQIDMLTNLTRLNSLSLTVAPGNRMEVKNVNAYHGFPTSVTALTALTNLRLSGWTYMGAVPEGIGSLTALKELLFSNCVITRLPVSLQKLTDLEQLDLTSNSLGRPNAASVERLLHAHKLTSIRLSGNHYSHVPAYLSCVTALQSLHIANNSIGTGSTSCLSHLTALTKLVMQQCNLRAVPDSLAALSRLQWLCLSRNHLERVPVGLPWHHLELLHLRGNDLRSLPCDALSKAVQLQTLDCGDNLPLQMDDYMAVWMTIKQLPSLENLFIDKTGDEEAPDSLLWTDTSVGQIASLKKLIKKRKCGLCLGM